MKRTIIAIALLACSVFSTVAILISQSICVEIPGSYTSVNLMIALNNYGLLIPFIISVIFIGISLIMLFIEYFRSFKEKP
mgnify:FL=1